LKEDSSIKKFLQPNGGVNSGSKISFPRVAFEEINMGK